MADLLSKPLGYKSNGFSEIYNRSVSVAGVLYMLLGLLFLRKYLQLFFTNTITNLALLSVFLATNLFYYAINDTGMSHVYSFALFSIYIYLVQLVFLSSKITFWKFFTLGLVAGLIILIRPTNILFLSIYFFLNINTKKDFFNKIRIITNFKTVAALSLGILLAFVPQFMYWKYIFGSMLNYSYENEEFNWLNPQPLKTLFSTNNGLFLYTPFYFIIIFGLIFMMLKKIKGGLYIMLLCVLITYVFSSWWIFSFGCSYGARSYVEYLALFSIPIAYLYQYILSQTTIKKVVFLQ
jgi:hypothetical protein